MVKVHTHLSVRPTLRWWPLALGRPGKNATLSGYMNGELDQSVVTFQGFQGLLTCLFLHVCLFVANIH
jgi:hypothetical protein